MADTPRIDDRAITLFRLKQLGLALGTIAKPRREDAWVENPDNFSWMVGMAVVCSQCRKVVGQYRIETGEEFLDENAGWVLERRRKVQTGLILCGSGGCDAGPHYENPVACSDACETAILRDWRRWEHCEPPPGYQRGGTFP